MFKKRRITLLSIIGASIILIITLVLILLNSNKKQAKEIPDEQIDTSKLEAEFKNLFNSMENEYIKTIYDIQEEESGKYDIVAKIPYVNFNEAIDNIVNTQINQIFVDTIVKIYSQSQQNTRIEIGYTSAINNNILSLVIRCILKEGSNAQRTIIKTYNYDLTNYRQVNLLDVIPKESITKVQEEIHEKIQKEIDKENRRSELGYNSYKRNADSDIYLIQNATEFFIKDNILYIIYSYGNNNYTSSVDLIITKI